MTNILDLFKFVMKNMFEKKSRVLITISGIIIGIFTFSLILLTSEGIENAVVSQFSSFGLDVIIIQKYGQGGGGPPEGDGLTDTDIAKIKQVAREYKYVAPFIFHTTIFEFNREKIPQVTLAYDSEYWEEVSNDIGIEIEEGRNIRPGDKGVVILGYKTAQDSYDREVDIGTSLKYENKNYRVIGIIESRGDLFVDNSIITTFDDIQEISEQDTYSGIRVSFLEGADINASINAIDRKLNPNSDEKNIEISSPSQAIEQFGELILLIQIVLGVFSSFVLIVGGINVMNTMYSNTLERVNEISVMKAMGGTNGDIRIIFLVESAILGLIGSIVGFLLAYGLAEFISYAITNFANFNFPVFFRMDFFVFVTALTTFFTMVFGTYPALKAAKVDPADNLRDE